MHSAAVENGAGVKCFFQFFVQLQYRRRRGVKGVFVLQFAFDKQSRTAAFAIRPGGFADLFCALAVIKRPYQFAAPLANFFAFCRRAACAVGDG